MATLRDFQNEIAELQSKEREKEKARAILVSEKEKERKGTKVKEKPKDIPASNSQSNDLEAQTEEADNTGVDIRLQVFSNIALRNFILIISKRIYYTPKARRMLKPLVTLLPLLSLLTKENTSFDWDPIHREI